MLIPPSLLMIIFGILAEASIGDLFIAGIIPGILLSASFMIYIAASELMRGARVTEQPILFVEKLRRSVDLIPPFIIFGAVMGSLYLGFATPTESASIGVVIALFLAGIFGRLDREMLMHCFRQTAVLTGTIMSVTAARVAAQGPPPPKNPPPPGWIDPRNPPKEDPNFKPARRPDVPVFLPDQRLDLATALTAYTAGSAHVAYLDESGVIAPGRLADLAVLDRDPFAGPPEEIAATRVVATYVEGEPVFEA